MPIWRRLEREAAWRERFSACWMAGTAKAASTPMMETTTSNSTKVKPRRRCMGEF